MTGTRWKLFQVRGIPIRIDASWLLIFGLLAMSLYFLFRDTIPGLGVPLYEVMAAATALLFFTCIVLHELGHALVARTVGIRIRGITLFIFGGVAEMEDEPRSAAAEFVMAIAGPAVSLVLGVFFLTIAVLAPWPPLAFMLVLLGQINLALIVFNMVPAFPLDGGRVLRSALWWATGSIRRATRWAAMAGQGFGLALMSLGLLLALTGHLAQGIWLALIGMFVRAEALRSHQSMLIQQALRGEPITRFMGPPPVAVPASTDLDHWVHDYVYRFHRRVFPVIDRDELEGVVRIESLKRFPRPTWPEHHVGEVMQSDVEEFTIGADADALQGLEKMWHHGSTRLMVTDGHRVTGTVSLKDLETFLDLKLTLEGGDDGELPRRRPSIRNNSTTGQKV